MRRRTKLALLFACGCALWYLGLFSACGEEGDTAQNLIDAASLGSISVAKVSHVDRAHYRVETPQATYLVDSASGGLSGLIDIDENDWVAYRGLPWGEYPASASSSYRGVPNLVFRSEFDGAGHPGHNKASCDVVGTNQISCHTPGGPWAWTWTFESNYALLDVTEVSDTSAYWFLYEGPAGGSYQPKQTYFATESGSPAYTQYDHFKGEEEVDQRDWYYFGNDAVPRTLFILQLNPDTLLDHYSLLGSNTLGIDSPDGMVVAGFGRGPSATPLMRRPNRFAIGFSEGAGTSEKAYERKSEEMERIELRYPDD